MLVRKLAPSYTCLANMLQSNIDEYYSSTQDIVRNIKQKVVRYEAEHAPEII